jgi:hypothetical protein
MKEKLNVYAKNVTSHAGEDGIIEYIVASLGRKIVRIAAEVGASNGVKFSNCHTLWASQGWEAVLIEGNPETYQRLLQNVGDRKNVKTVNKFIATRGRGSLDDIFKTLGMGPEIGLLTIDIDSSDYHVFKHLEYLKPQILIVEHNENIPPHIDYYDPEGEFFLRCSAKSLERVGREKGYKLICCTKLNSIFMREDLFDPKKFPDMPVEWLFDYSELSSQIIFTGSHRNRFPVFSKETSIERKAAFRVFYRLFALFKRKVKFIKPSEKVVDAIRRSGMDV